MSKITSAKVEFNYSTQKLISVEFSVERTKMPANAFVYRHEKKQKKILPTFQLNASRTFQLNFKA